MNLTPTSVLPGWLSNLTFQQQSVLILGLRGPDGVRKDHPMKAIQRAYRGTILKAARYGRVLESDEIADTFMSMEYFSDHSTWALFACKPYFQHIDELPHHFHNHLMHGAQILGYKHPEERYRDRWQFFYRQCVKDAHLNIETEAQMDHRLSDWGREDWDEARP